MRDVYCMSRLSAHAAFSIKDMANLGSKSSGSDIKVAGR